MAQSIVTEEKRNVQANEASLAFCPLGAMLAKNDIDGVVMVLAHHWEHLSKTGVNQLLERTVESCRQFAPAEVRNQLDLILDYSTRVRVKHGKSGEA